MHRRTETSLKNRQPKLGLGEAEEEESHGAPERRTARHEAGGRQADAHKLFSSKRSWADSITWRGTRGPGHAGPRAVL